MLDENFFTDRHTVCTIIGHTLLALRQIFAAQLALESFLGALVSMGLGCRLTLVRPAETPHRDLIAFLAVLGATFSPIKRNNHSIALWLFYESVVENSVGVNSAPSLSICYAID